MGKIFVFLTSLGKYPGDIFCLACAVFVIEGVYYLSLLFFEPVTQKTNKTKTLVLLPKFNTPHLEAGLPHG